MFTYSLSLSVCLSVCLLSLSLLENTNELTLFTEEGTHKPSSNINDVTDALGVNFTGPHAEEPIMNPDSKTAAQNEAKY